MGFRSKWLSWIKSIISSASISILIKSSPTKCFLLEKGIRQGDPLSPYLFIIAIEGLIVALKEAVYKELFKGLALPVNDSEIASLQYTNGAIFLGEWSDQSVCNLLKILHYFHLTSALKINWSKSTLSVIKFPTSNVSRLTSAPGCKVGRLPFKYLDIRIGPTCLKW